MARRQETYSLEQACGGSFFPTADRMESVLLNLLLPLCLKVGSGSKGTSTFTHFPDQTPPIDCRITFQLGIKSKQ